MSGVEGSEEKLIEFLRLQEQASAERISGEHLLLFQEELQGTHCGNGRVGVVRHTDCVEPLQLDRSGGREGRGEVGSRSWHGERGGSVGWACVESKEKGGRSTGSFSLVGSDLLTLCRIIGWTRGLLGLLVWIGLMNRWVEPRAGASKIRGPLPKSNTGPTV